MFTRWSLVSGEDVLWIDVYLGQGAESRRYLSSKEACKLSRHFEQCHHHYPPGRDVIVERAMETRGVTSDASQAMAASKKNTMKRMYFDWEWQSSTNKNGSTP